MTKITSRAKKPTLKELCMKELADEVAAELDELTTRLDSWLEERITEEFEELRADIKGVSALNEALLSDNIRLGFELDRKQALLERLAATMDPVRSAETYHACLTLSQALRGTKQ